MIYSFKLRLVCCFLVLVTVAELSNGASYVNRNTEPVRCYDCDYDPNDQHGKGSDRHSEYGQSGTGNGNAGGPESSNQVMETLNVRRGFQRCALDKSTDDQHYVRETECQYGVCFIRKDHNGLVYRGCADPKNLPLDVDPSVQCQPQGLRPALWWFCNGTRCNSGSFDGQSGVCNNSSRKSNQMTGSGNPYIVGPAEGHGADRGGSMKYPNAQIKPKLPASAYQAPMANADKQESYSGSSQYGSPQPGGRVQKFDTSSSSASYSGSDKKEQTNSAKYTPAPSRQSPMSSGSGKAYSKPSYDKQQTSTSKPTPNSQPAVPDSGHMIAIPVISLNAAHMPQSSMHQSDSAGKPPSYSASDAMNYLLFMSKLHGKLGDQNENGGSDISSRPKLPVEYEMKSQSTSTADRMSYYPAAAAGASERVPSMYPEDLTVGGSMETMIKDEPGAYGQNENMGELTATTMAVAAVEASAYGDHPYNSNHVVMSENDDADQSAANNMEDSSFNPCDGQCLSNPSGLFPDPSSQDFFIQCGPNRDPDVGTPCQCCRPQRMRCPITTSFNHVTKVCSGSGSIELGHDSGSIGVTTQTDSLTGGTAENQLPAEMIFGYN